MLKIIKILLTFISLLIFIVLIPACSDYNSSEPESEDTGSVSFHVEWKGAPTHPERDNGNLRALDCQASNIETVTFDIRENNDISLAEDTWECIAGKGIVNGVPAGIDRKLVVEGKDSQGRVYIEDDAECCWRPVGFFKHMKTYIKPNGERILSS